MSKAKKPAFDRDAWRLKIAAQSDIKPLKVNVPFWGECHVMALTREQARALNDTSANGVALDTKYGDCRIVASLVCDPDGNALFDKNSIEDLEFLNSQRASTIGVLLKAITKHNGWDSEELKNA